MEVGECKIGNRKYNRGRLVEGVWVLDMIELNDDVDTVLAKDEEGVVDID